MEQLVSIESSFFPGIYPKDHREKVYTDQRVEEVSACREVLTTELPVRLVGGGYARKEKVRIKVYHQYELTLFAKESERLDVIMMALSILVRFDDYTTHHAFITEVGQPVRVENTSHLKYRVRYIDMNPENYFEEPVSDFLSSHVIMNQYLPNMLYRLKLHSWADFGDEWFGRQRREVALNGTIASLNMSDFWELLLAVDDQLSDLETGQDMRIGFTSGLTWPEVPGVVIQKTNDQVRILTTITSWMMSEALMPTVTLSLMWSRGLTFATRIVPGQDFSDVGEKATERDGLSIASRTYGSEMMRATFFLNEADHFRLKKYAGLLTGDAGTVTMVTPEGEEKVALERIKPETTKLDEGLWKAVLPMKIKQEVVNTFNV